ncbi:MAG: BON domain-containing protein [Acidobacteriota bacterium]
MKPREQSITDKRLRHDVISQLDYEQAINSTEIGVSTSDGIVTLTGFVSSYAEKVAAEKATQRVYGVKAVANDLQVNPILARTDSEIAKSVVKAFESNLVIPSEKIKVTVKQGIVTLQGAVEGHFQKTMAENVVKYLPGVNGITNKIEIKPIASAEEIKGKIEEALRRNAIINASRINVEISDQIVMLTGSVTSVAEKRQAEYAAWAAPGVSKVINQIAVVP